jgi:hypothetical protein
LFFGGFVAEDGFVSVGPVVAIESPSIRAFFVNKHSSVDVSGATTNRFDLPIKIPENLITVASELVFATSQDSPKCVAANLKVIFVRCKQKPELAWDVGHWSCFRRSRPLKLLKLG